MTTLQKPSCSLTLEQASTCPLAISVRTTGLDPEKDKLLAVDLAWESADKCIVDRTIFVKTDINERELHEVNRFYKLLNIEQIPEDYHEAARPKEEVKQRILQILTYPIIIYNNLTTRFLAQVAVFPDFRGVLTFEHLSGGMTGIPATSLLLNGLGYPQDYAKCSKAVHLLLLYKHYREGADMDGRRTVSRGRL